MPSRPSVLERVARPAARPFVQRSFDGDDKSAARDARSNVRFLRCSASSVFCLRCLIRLAKPLGYQGRKVKFLHPARVERRNKVARLGRPWERVK